MAAFEYAGEGPEIGQTYRYRFSGFVVHEPETVAVRFKRFRERVASAAGDFSGLHPRKSATKDQPKLQSRLLRMMRERLRTRYRFRTLAIALPSRLRFRELFAALLRLRDFPLTVQGVSLACCLAIIGYFHVAEHPAAGIATADALAELRLTTGSLTLPPEVNNSPAGTPAKPEAWRNAKGKTLPIFALEAAELGSLVHSYTSRSKGSTREDMLVWDERPANAGAAPFKPLVLIVAQRRSEAQQGESLYLETTRRAALHGLSVARAATPGDLPTKFGTFEVADMIMGRGVESGEAMRSCLAFRQAAASVVFRLSGWLCAQQDKVIERPTLAAIIGKLTLIGAGADRDLHQIFIDADMKKDAASGSHAARKTQSWIDQTGEKPVLKGSKAAGAG